VLWSLATTVRKWPIVVLRSEEHVVGNFPALSAPPRPQLPHFQTQAGGLFIEQDICIRAYDGCRWSEQHERSLVPGYVGRSVCPIGTKLCSFTYLFEDTARSSCLQQLGGSHVTHLHGKHRCLLLIQSRFDSNCHPLSPLRTDLDLNTGHTSVFCIDPVPG
jgi:hypothetical protein